MDHPQLAQGVADGHHAQRGVEDDGEGHSRRHLVQQAEHGLAAKAETESDGGQGQGARRQEEQA